MKAVWEKEGIPLSEAGVEFVDMGNWLLNFLVSGYVDGGLPLGRIVEIMGLPSVGKSLMVYNIFKANSSRRLLVLDDVESAYEKRLFTELGIADSYILWRSLTVEDHFATFMKFSDVLARHTGFDDIGAVVALDSLAALSTKHAQEVGLSKRDLQRAAQISTMLREIRPHLLKHRILYIIVNHYTSGMGFEADDSPGGRAPKFYAAVRLLLSRRGYLFEEVEGKKREVGIKIEARVVKNKCFTPYTSPVLLDLFWYRGIPKLSGIETLLLTIGAVVQRPGGWYRLPGKEKNYRVKEIQQMAADHQFDDVLPFYHKEK